VSAVTEPAAKDGALARAASLLRCPHCAARMSLDDETVGCAAGHRFDVARQGYVNLLAGDARPGTADTSAMVAARAQFLGRGHYAALAAEVARQAAAGVADGCVVDVGAGTGYYLARALDATPERLGVALDLSKHAARRAARAHPRGASFVADAWAGLPLRDGVAAAVLSVFAPRNAAEAARVLAPGGVLVVATPTRAHLRELVGPLGLLGVDADKAGRLETQLGAHFEPSGSATVEQPLRLTDADVAAAVGMGPSAWHVDAAELVRRSEGLEQEVDGTMRATLAVTVSTYTPRRALTW
jgi:23S rRNA (guanine745-N1)-methyltransferase